MSSSSSSSSDSETSSSGSSDSEPSESVSAKSHDNSDDDDMKLPAPQPAAAPPCPFPIRKGSRTYPSGKTHKMFDSKQKHYRHLHKIGRERMKEARVRRQKLRDTLMSHDDNFNLQQYPTLQSSSSEESDVEESNSDWERDTVDFQAMAHESWWAQESLYGVLPVSEISSLVGWATHQTHDGKTNVGDTPLVSEAVVAVDGDTAAKAANESQPEAAVRDHNDATANEAAPHQEADTGKNDPLCHEQANPLLGLPNTPLPPSHLLYLTEKARALMEQSVQESDEWKPHSFLTNPAFSDDRPARKRHKRKDWQQWEYDSGDETYQSLKDKGKSHVTIHVPRPHRKQVKSNEKEKAKQKDSNSNESRMYHSLDDSALVALGMVWEGMITASLLPLARQHVARCRRLEQQRTEDTASGEVFKRSEEEDRMDPFQEWTLPPEQAIWRLAQEGVSSELASALPPTRVSNKVFDRESSMKEMLVNRLGSTEQHKQQAVDDWCRTRDLDPAFVSNNMDLFGVLLPRAPSVSTPVVQETIREKEDRYGKLWQKRVNAKITAKTAPSTRKDDEPTGPTQRGEESSEEEEQIESVAV